MQPSIDFNQSDSYYFEAEEGTTNYAYETLTALRPKAKKIVAIGGRVLLFANLLQSGCPIIHIDRNQNELEVIRKGVEECGTDLTIHLTNARLVITKKDTKWLDYISRDDCVFFYDTLHHLEEPAGVLTRIREKLGRGWIVILDTTLELMRNKWSSVLWNKGESLKECREDVKKGLLSVESLVEEENQWREYEEGIFSCREGMQRAGFYNERSVRSFLFRAGMETENFWYCPPCPCGNMWCNKVMTFWMCAWHTPL